MLDKAAQLPRTVEHLTAAWMTAALGERFPGVEVSAVETKEVIWGTATKVRLHLSYAVGGRPAELPEAVCVKGGFDERISGFAVESAYDANAELRGKRVFLFAGIARPDGFARTVRALGGEIAGARWFRDHHLFTARELAQLHRLVSWAHPATTEKDLVRIADPAGVAAVRIDVRILSGADVLDRALEAIL